MTKKRFRLIDYEEYYYTYGDDLKGEEIDNPFDVVDLLNALHEENIMLKSENQELKNDNDIKFWKLQLMKQWNETQIITHELSLAIDNGYEVSDEFRKYMEDLKKKHEEHIKKVERLGI